MISTSTSTRLVGSPLNGDAAVGAGGITYTPLSGYHGVDSFTYEVCDSGNRCDTATVTVVVNPSDGAPPPPGSPSPPLDVQVARADGAARVSWTAPLATGDTPVSEYTVTASPGGSSCSTASTSCVVTGLINGVSYQFTVTASNANGESSPSAPSEVVVPQPPSGTGGGGGSGGGGGAVGGGGAGGGTDTEPPEGAARSVVRLHGPDRFATAVAVSQRSFSEGVPVVYLATGGQFADALAAGPVASGAGPILLVRRDSIPAVIAEELERLAPDGLSCWAVPRPYQVGFSKLLGRSRLER